MNAGVLYAKYAARLCYVKNGGISQSALPLTCYIKHGISKYTECVYVRWSCLASHDHPTYVKMK